MRLQVRVSALPTSGRPYNRWRPHTYARLASRVGSATSAGQLFEAGRRGDQVTICHISSTWRSDSPSWLHHLESGDGHEAGSIGLFAMDTEAGEEGKNASDGSPTAEREDKEQGDGSAAAPAEAGGEGGEAAVGGGAGRGHLGGEAVQGAEDRREVLGGVAPEVSRAEDFVFQAG
ncbi:hypothetical protein GW17_00031952 [Ensete ventricosum]|nr:hypothetical protein GW17_00031952 [Ensete ventricosum]